MDKRYFLIAIIIFVSSLVAATAFISQHKKDVPLNDDRNGFAVVELFTSEGCSSCPPADETVARLLKKNLQQVYILSYHVDYWNKLGWKDQFSNAEYTQRQQQYAAAFHLDGVYTPQIVVNGSAEFVGSDEQKLTAAVDKVLSLKAMHPINIDVNKNGTAVTVSYTIDGQTANSTLLNIALVQPEAFVAVKKGENGGRTLRHVNIVRELKTIDAVAKGQLSFFIPADLAGKPLQVIAYTQDKETYHISGAIQKTI
jgi:hypothetical protein